jgi:hypothetical protein
MFRWKTWARIPRMFHGENIVFLTCRAAVFKRRVGLTVVLRWSYGGLMIQVTENCLELSKDEGIKNVRETSDMVGSSNGIHEMNRNKTIKTFPFLPCVLLA